MVVWRWNTQSHFLLRYKIQLLYVIFIHADLCKYWIICNLRQIVLGDVHFPEFSCLQVAPLATPFKIYFLRWKCKKNEKLAQKRSLLPTLITLGLPDLSKSSTFPSCWFLSYHLEAFLWWQPQHEIWHRPIYQTSYPSLLCLAQHHFVGLQQPVLNIIFSYTCLFYVSFHNRFTHAHHIECHLNILLFM